MNQRLCSQTEMAMAGEKEIEGGTLAHVTEWRPFILRKNKIEK